MNIFSMAMSYPKQSEGTFKPKYGFEMYISFNTMEEALEYQNKLNEFNEQFVSKEEC